MNMKRIIALTFIAFLLVAVQSQARTAFGSSFGTFATASSQGMGHGEFGFGIGLGDNATSFIGTFSYGLSKYTDGRIKLALVDPDGPGDTKFAVGADVKWQFWNVSSNTTNPFDFAIGGLLEYTDYDGPTVFEVGGFLLASYPISMTNRTVLTPYGRFNARLERIDYPGTILGNNSDSNLEIGLSGGVEWTMTSTVKLFGELQLDGNDGLFFGVNLGVM